MCHRSFGPELFPTTCMLRLFDLLSPDPGPDGSAKAGLDDWTKNAVSDCPPDKLLGAAFAWLSGIDDEELYHLISVKELTVVRVKAEGVAAGLTFAALSVLHGQTTLATGFQRLLGLGAFLPTIARLEKRSKLQVQKYVVYFAID